MTLCKTDYQQVFDTIQAYTGLRIHDGRFDAAVQVVDDLLNAGHLQGINDLLLHLKATAFTEPLWQEFIQNITVGETYFFRDQGQFDALRMHILPQLIADRQKTGNRQLRLWSAGCASGEEPYSLAMLLHEVVPNIETWNITILGTDINFAFLERARRGLYRPSSFRKETPEYLRKRWFKSMPNGYELDRAIRDMVVFSPLNLASSDYRLYENLIQNMDIIVCRNVTIYFEQTTVQEIVGRFYNTLNDKGSLIVGHSELSTETYHEFSMRRFEKTVFYQKTASSNGRKATLPPRASHAGNRPNSRPPIVLPPSPLPEPKPLIVPKISLEQSLEAAWGQAKKAADREKWDEALDNLKRVESKHLFRPELHYLRGLVQLAAGNADEALWAWRQALYCDPTFALAHYSLGDLYVNRGETKFATRHWRQALTAIEGLDPQHFLLFTEDVTVEMLQGLLTYRFSTLLNGNGREQV